MSQSIIVPPVHETSPPPFDDEFGDNDAEENFNEQDILPSNTLNLSNDDNDDWKSIDDEPTPQMPDQPSISENPPVTDIPDQSTADEKSEQIVDDDTGWANFATFESSSVPVVENTSVMVTNGFEDSNEDNWAQFQSNPEPTIEQPVATPAEELPENTEIDEDDFGEFSEVQVTTQPQTPSLPSNGLNMDQIESLISSCFPVDSSTPSTNENSTMYSVLPSFTSLKTTANTNPYFEPSLSLWKVLSNLSNDPIGITFQWRKSNTERLFHQALGVNERFRTKSVPLTPEVLQPEKIKPVIPITNEFDNAEQESKLPSNTHLPHFDWKQSGLENPLADQVNPTIENGSSSISPNINKNEENVFDANKTLDLDFYVPATKSTSEDESISVSSSTSQKVEISSISKQRSSIPIKTMDLFPGSTTMISDDAKRVLDTLPNLSFMSAKALMFPVRFNGTNNHDDSTSLY